MLVVGAAVDGPDGIVVRAVPKAETHADGTPGGGLDGR